MSKIMEVYTSNEVEDMTGYSTTHIRRLLKKEELALVENEDYRRTKRGIYLFTDIAIEKIFAYKI